MATAPPYNNSVVPCLDDLSCPGNSQCVIENVILNKTKMICSCGPEWGNGGLLCDEYGAMSYFLMVFHSILVAVFAYIFFLVSSRLIYLKKQNKLSTLNAKATTLILLNLGCVFCLTLHASNVYAYANPNNLILSYDSVFGYRKYTSAKTLRAVSSIIFSFFLISSVLNIGILWLEVAISSNKFQKLNNPQLSSRYATFVAVIDVFLAITMAVAFAFSENYVAMALGPIILFIIVVYSYSSYSISKVINEQVSSGRENGDIVGESSENSIKVIQNGEREAKMKATLTRIRKCAIIIITSIILATVTPTIQSILETKQRNIYILPSSFYIPYLFLDVAYICHVVTCYTVYWYIHGSTLSQNSSHGSKADLRSVRLYPTVTVSSISPPNLSPQQ